MSLQRITVVSDLHHAGALEREREGFCMKSVSNPLLRGPLFLWRRFLWERDPFAHAGLLDEFLRNAPAADLLVANGDYSCDSAFVGVSDEAAFHSAEECLGKLRRKFGGSVHATIGDHELGKIGLGSSRGGLRLASFARTVEGLAVPPFWQLDLGRYTLVGVTSTLLALPVYLREAPAEERPAWEEIRVRHCEEIRRTFCALPATQRVILFCHDPTALPFLARVPGMAERLGQVELTIIGHLHSELLFRLTRWLRRMPRVNGLGPFLRRITHALHEARAWEPFRVRLCPALRGIELLKDGGFCTLEVDPGAASPVKFWRHRMALP